MQETRVWSLGQEDPLEKGMEIPSSILAWRIPWTEEPGGLQSMGSQESDMTEATKHVCLYHPFPFHYNLQVANSPPNIALNPGVHIFQTHKRKMCVPCGHGSRDWREAAIRSLKGRETKLPLKLLEGTPPCLLFDSEPRAPGLWKRKMLLVFGTSPTGL